MGTNWHKLINDAREEVGDDSDVVAVVPSLFDWHKEFDDGFGGSEGEPFTVWTKNRVYFPMVYDGSEWVGSAPRDPCDEVSKHKGGQ